MALSKKVYGVKTPVLLRIFSVHGVFDHHLQSRKPVAAQSEIGNLAGLQLKLQFVSDKGDKFQIRGCFLGMASGKDLQKENGLEVAKDCIYCTNKHNKI